jgi:hypothetical protein
MGDTPWFGSTIFLISMESKPIYRDSLAFVTAARSRAGVTRGYGGRAGANDRSMALQISIGWE